MKRFILKKYPLLLVAILSLVCFNSCKDDEKPVQQPSVNQEKKFEAILTNQVVKDIGITDSCIAIIDGRNQLMALNRVTGAEKFYHDGDGTHGRVCNIDVKGETIYFGESLNGIWKLSNTGDEAKGVETSLSVFKFDYTNHLVHASGSGSIAQVSYFPNSVFNKHTKFIGPPEAITDLISFDDEAWVSLNPNGLARFADDRVYTFSSGEGTLTEDEVLDLCLGSDEKLYILSNSVLSVVEFSSTIKTLAGFDAGTMIGMVVVADELVLYGTKGLYKLGENGTLLPWKEVNEYLPEEKLNVIEVDQNGDLWMGTDKGLYIYRF